MEGAQGGSAGPWWKRVHVGTGRQGPMREKSRSYLCRHLAQENLAGPGFGLISYRSELELAQYTAAASDI